MIAKQYFGSGQIDRLLDSLPHIQPLPRDITTTTLPAKHRGAFWYEGPGYAGFTSAEREREYMLQLWLESAGFLPAPTHCSICPSTNRVGYHAENYYDLWRMPSLCWACHMALHKRGKQLRAWKFLVENHTVRGDEWFALVPDDPETDIAGHLRHKHGEDYRWVEKTSLRCTPAWAVPPPFPKRKATSAVRARSTEPEILQQVAPPPLTDEERARPIRRMSTQVLNAGQVLNVEQARAELTRSSLAPEPPPALRLRTRLPTKVRPTG